MELSFLIQHPETGIQYLSQMLNKFGPCNYRQDFVDVALISAYSIRYQAQTMEGSSTGIDAGVSVKTSVGENISNFGYFFH